jgi:N,N'-diacetyllegionaminate synthase
MKIGSFDLQERVFVVAEIGNNHEGSYALAEEMIGLASETGVDAVKFQTFIPGHYVSSDQTERLQRLRRFALTAEQFRSLAGFANARGVQFFSTPFDLASADVLAAFCPAIKISSGDNNFFPLIERVASFGLPIILSTGVADLSDIDEVRKRIIGVWSSQNHSGELVLLHCVSSYPTPIEAANLAAIRTLSQKFGDCTVGYSDHTLGIEAAVLSVGLGARIIEKHFTLRKDYSDFRDHQLSADPAEMAELVRRVRLAEQLLGDGKKQRATVEEPIRIAIRRSIAASRHLPAGATLGWDDLTWVRPGGGLAPGEEARALGRTLVRGVAAGQILQSGDFA